MNRLLTTLMIFFLLSGCMYQTVTGIEVNKAIAYCKDKGGVEYMSSRFDGKEVVYCVDLKMGKRLVLLTSEGEEAQ